MAPCARIRRTRDAAIGTVSGTLDLLIETETAGMKLAFYDDEDNSWPAIYESSMSCEQRLEHAKK